MSTQRRVKANEAKQKLENVLALLEYLIDEEQAALEGIPENMQARVERCEDILSDLQDAKSSVEDAISQLDSAADR